MSETKRLYKSHNDKMVCGVCSGIGDYFNVDPTLIRLAWVVFTVLTMFWTGIIAYVIACIIIPEEPGDTAPTAVAQ